MRYALILFLLAGCDVDVQPVAVEDTFELGANPAVDVLFVVDDSNTMGKLHTAAGVTFANLEAAFTAAGSDWQIGVTTTDFDDPAARGRLVEVSGGGDRVLDPSDDVLGDRFQNAMNVGVDGSQTERGLQAAWAAVTSPLATHENAGFVRDDARLAIVILSDEDDCSDEGDLGVVDPSDCQTRPDVLTPLDEYVTRFSGLKDVPGDVAVHALVETGDLETGCGLPNPGTRYVDVARRTGGIVLPPCGDFGGLMDQLAGELVGLRRAYPLTRTADVTSLEVTVESATLGTTALVEDLAGATGWTYDAAANALLLGSEVALSLDSTVRIAYTVPAT